MTKFESFSERYRYIQVSNVVQFESMTDSLKNCLWNVIRTYVFVLLVNTKFIKSFFHNFLKESFDRIPVDEQYYEEYIKKVYSNFSWNEVYDFIEFLYFKDSEFDFPSLADDSFKKIKEKITKNINSILENESSSYRLIDGKITPITDNNEIKEIEEAINENNDNGVITHLKTALDYLSDRNNKDYRNSIKESISAVEVFTRKITEENNLGKALSKLESKNICIPKVLKEGFEKIYGWTNGSDGIRHGLMYGKNSIGMAEAKFMLVVCSAFINYLKMKQKIIEK